MNKASQNVFKIYKLNDIYHLKKIAWVFIKCVFVFGITPLLLYVFKVGYDNFVKFAIGVIVCHAIYGVITIRLHLKNHILFLVFMLISSFIFISEWMSISIITYYIVMQQRDFMFPILISIPHIVAGIIYYIIYNKKIHSKVEKKYTASQAVAIIVSCASVGPLIGYSAVRMMSQQGVYIFIIACSTILTSLFMAGVVNPILFIKTLLSDEEYMSKRKREKR